MVLKNEQVYTHKPKKGQVSYFKRKRRGIEEEIEEEIKEEIE